MLSYSWWFDMSFVMSCYMTFLLLKSNVSFHFYLIIQRGHITSGNTVTSYSCINKASFPFCGTARLPTADYTLYKGGIPGRSS